MAQAYTLRANYSSIPECERGAVVRVGILLRQGLFEGSDFFLRRKKLLGA
jgi:hypothetical protein